MSLLIKRKKKYTRPLGKGLNKYLNRYNFENLNGFRRKKYKNAINGFDKWFLPLKHNKGVFRQSPLSSERTYFNSRLFYRNLHLLSSYIYYRILTRSSSLNKVLLICDSKCLYSQYSSNSKFTNITGVEVNTYLNHIVLNSISFNTMDEDRFNLFSKPLHYLETSSGLSNFTDNNKILPKEEHFDFWLLIRLLKVSTYFLNRKCLLGIYFSSSSYFNVNNYYFLSLKNVHVFNTLLLPRSLALLNYNDFNSSKLFSLNKFEFFTVSGKNFSLTQVDKNLSLKGNRLNAFKINFNTLKKYGKYVKYSLYLKRSKRFLYSKLIRRYSYAFFKKGYTFKKLNLNKSKHFKKMKFKRILKGSFKKSKRFLNLINFKIRLYAKVDFVHKNFDYNKKIINVKGVTKVPVYSTHSSISKKFNLFNRKFVKLDNIYTIKNLALTRSNFRLVPRNNALLPISKCFNLFSFAFFVKLSYLYSFDNTLRFLYKGLETNLIPSTQGFNYVVWKNLYSNRLNLSFRENTTPWMYNNIIRFMEFHSGRKVMLDVYSFMYQSIDFNYVVLYKFWLVRFSYYERRLGHRFFLEEALHILHMSFSYQDSKLLSSWLKSMIKRISFWKTRFIFRFIRYLFNNYFRFLFKELGIKGLKIKLKGKISVAGNSRKRCILYRIGKTSHSTLDLKVVHTPDTIVTFTGVMGFQIWIFY